MKLVAFENHSFRNRSKFTADERIGGGADGTFALTFSWGEVLKNDDYERNRTEAVWSVFTRGQSIFSPASDKCADSIWSIFSVAHFEQLVSLSSCRPRVDSPFRVTNFCSDFTNVSFGFSKFHLSENVETRNNEKRQRARSLYFWHLLLKFVTSVHLDTETRNGWVLAIPRNRSLFNLLRWQLIADHNERPSRVQQFVAFFSYSSV